MRPDDEHRCVWVKPNGRRCTKPRSEDGGDKCHFHRAQLQERMQLLTLAKDQPDVPVEEHLKLQLRMAYTAVKLTELEMHDLGYDYEAFMWKMKETEDREGGPGGGYTSVRRARQLGAHPLMVQYLKEREMHLKVIQTCIGAGIAARQVQAVERFVENVMQFATVLAEGLGHDPESAETRQVIVESLRKMEGQMRDTVPRAALEA